MIYPTLKYEMSSYVRAVGLGLVLMLLLLGAFSRAAVEIDDGRTMDALFGNNGGPNMIPQTVAARADRDAETQTAEGERQAGTVRWFNARKGYGYITPDDGGTSLFVHYSAIRGTGFRTLSAGQRVDFVVGRTAKGPSALDVRLLDSTDTDKDAETGTDGGARQTGTVRWFNARKGYGYITPDAGGRSLYVHFSSIRGARNRTLSAWQRVDFVVGQTDKGPSALDVRLLDSAGTDIETESGTDEGARQTGTVRWFNARKGYGYITPDDEGRNLFVHFSAIRGARDRTLSAGQRVDFVVGQTAKGPSALDVKLLKP
jgi:CspA family cold shock protein